MNARRAVACAGVGLLMLSQVHAQAGRDPTLAPPEAGVVVPQAGGGAVAPPAPHYSVIVQDGQPRLVVGTRLVAPGGMVGDAKLERITETEIWLRKGKELRKVPRFAGIQRTAAVTATPGSAAAACPPQAAASSKVKRVAAKPSSSAGASPAGCAAVQP